MVTKIIFDKCFLIFIFITLLFSDIPLNAAQIQISCTGTAGYYFQGTDNLTTGRYVTISGPNSDYTFHYDFLYGNAVLATVIWGSTAGGRYTIKYEEKLLGIVIHTAIIYADVIPINNTKSSLIVDDQIIVWATNSIIFNPGFSYTPITSSSYLRGYISDCSGNPVGSSLKFGKVEDDTLKNEFVDISSTTYELKFNSISKSNSIINGNEEKIELYPNPVKDLINIKGVASFNGFITDLSGKKLLQINNQSNYIDVSILKSGVYILNLKGEGKILVEKFIKQ